MVASEASLLFLHPPPLRVIARLRRSRGNLAPGGRNHLLRFGTVLCKMKRGNVTLFVSYYPCRMSRKTMRGALNVSHKQFE